MGRNCKLVVVMGLAVVGLAVPIGEALAQAIDQALEQRIAKEKEARRDCKIKICDAALNKKASGAAYQEYIGYAGSGTCNLTVSCSWNFTSAAAVAAKWY